MASNILPKNIRQAWAQGYRFQWFLQDSARVLGNHMEIRGDAQFVRGKQWEQAITVKAVLRPCDRPQKGPGWQLRDMDAEERRRQNLPYTPFGETVLKWYRISHSRAPLKVRQDAARHMIRVLEGPQGLDATAVFLAEKAHNRERTKDTQFLHELGIEM